MMEATASSCELKDMKIVLKHETQQLAAPTSNQTEDLGADGEELL